MNFRRVAIATLVMVFGLGLVGSASMIFIRNTYVHLVHPSNGSVYVGNSYLGLSSAAKSARGMTSSDPNLWVVTQRSRLYGDWNGHTLSFLKPILPESTVNAETLLSVGGTSLITLPAQLRSGPLPSPDVRFDAQFETVIFTLFLPDDADWLNPANSITFEIEYSDNSGASWNHMCGSTSTYGNGRPLDKNGVPSTGGSTGCSNRDGNNVLRPVSTWYHMNVTIPNPMTVGGEVAVPVQ